MHGANYEDATFNAGSRQDGDKMVTVYNINSNTKLNFAKRYFKSVQGVVLGPDGEVDISTENFIGSRNLIRLRSKRSKSHSILTGGSDWLTNWLERSTSRESRKGTIRDLLHVDRQ